MAVWFQIKDIYGKCARLLTYLESLKVCVIATWGLLKYSSLFSHVRDEHQ